MQARLTKLFTFEAAQTIPHLNPDHKCTRMHGHSFKIEISIQGEVNPHVGWIYDHANITQAMTPLLKLVDHAYLNEVEGLENPTIENICAWFWKKLSSPLPGLFEIVLHETPTARCSYRGN